MASFLDRYLEGQRVEVWDELVALGDRVREEPVCTDAVAVANETVRRVRDNAEVLIPRLAAKGYRVTDRNLDEKLRHVNRILSNIEACQGRRDWQRAFKQEEKVALELDLERMRTRPPIENARVFQALDEDTAYQDEQTANYLHLIEQRVNGPTLDLSNGNTAFFRERRPWRGPIFGAAARFRNWVLWG